MTDFQCREPRTVTAVVKRYFDYEESEANSTEKSEAGHGRRIPFYDSVRKNISSFDVGGIRKKASLLRAIGFESWHGVVNGCVAAFRNRFETDLRGNGQCSWKVGGKRNNRSSDGFWNRFCTSAFPDPRSAKALDKDTEDICFKFHESYPTNHQCHIERKNSDVMTGTSNTREGGLQYNCSAGKTVLQQTGEVLADPNKVSRTARTKDKSEAKWHDSFQKKCDAENDFINLSGYEGVGIRDAVVNDIKPKCTIGKRSEEISNPNRVCGPASPMSKAFKKDLAKADLSGLLPKCSTGRKAPRRYSEVVADQNRDSASARAENNFESKRGTECRKCDKEQHCTHHASTGARKHNFEADLSSSQFNHSAVGRKLSRRYSDAHADSKRNNGLVFSTDFGMSNCRGIQNRTFNTSSSQNPSCSPCTSRNLPNTPYPESSLHNTSHIEKACSHPDSSSISDQKGIDRCTLSADQFAIPLLDNIEKSNSYFEVLSNDNQPTREEKKHSCERNLTEKLVPDEVARHKNSVTTSSPSLGSQLLTSEDVIESVLSNSLNSPNSSRANGIRKRPAFPDPNRTDVFAPATKHQNGNCTGLPLEGDCCRPNSQDMRTSESGHFPDLDCKSSCRYRNVNCTRESNQISGIADASNADAASENLSGFQNKPTTDQSFDNRFETLPSVDVTEASQRGLHYSPIGETPMDQLCHESKNNGSTDCQQADLSSVPVDTNSENPGIASCPQDNVPKDFESKYSEVGNCQQADAPVHPLGCRRLNVPKDRVGRNPGNAGIADYQRTDMLTDLKCNISGVDDRLAWPECRNGPYSQYTSSLQTMLNKIPGLRRSQSSVTRVEPKSCTPETDDPKQDVVEDFYMHPLKAQKKVRLPDGKVAVGIGMVLLPPCPVHLAQIVRWKAESKKEEGNDAYKRKEYREALQLYTEAIELCPDYAAYYGNRSACHMMLGRYDAALADARQSTKLDDTFVKGHLREAKCNLALGDLAAAKCSLQKVERLEPTNNSLKEESNNIKCVEYFMVEALKGYEKKDFRQAVYHLDRALVSACACTRFQLQKAECLVFLNRYHEAQDITSDLIRGDGTNADAIYIRGLCLYYQDNIEKAFTHFQQVLRYAPDHTKAREAYKRARVLKQKKEEGNAAFRSGNLQQAYDTYSEALLIDSNNVFTNAKLYFNRALVSHKLKKLNQAVEDCTHAIKLDETYVKAYIKRGRCYQELEMHDESVRDFEKVYKLDSTQENHTLLQEAKLELKKSKRKDYYKILGIGRTASDDEIKKAYRKRALVHHPDRHANAPDDIKKEQEKKFKELGEAYSILSDPKKKSRYDCGQDIESSGDYDPYNIFQTFYSEPTARHFDFNNGRFPGGGYSGGFPGGFTFQFG